MSDPLDCPAGCARNLPSQTPASASSSTTTVLIPH
jgi:hypothetical protein